MTEEWIYVISLLCEIIFINIFAYHGANDDKLLVGSMRRLVVVVSITVLSSMLAIMISNENIGLVFQCIHYVGTEWMLIVLIQFLSYYGNVRLAWKNDFVLYILAGINSISILLNPIFHHMTTVKKHTISDGEILNQYTNHAPWYQMHLYYSYILVIISFVVLIYRLIHTVRLYRKKYLYALLMLIATVALDAICTIAEFDHDFSLYGYTTLVIFFIFFVMYYRPKSIIHKTLSYMVEDSHLGVVCFDPEDTCIFINDKALLYMPSDAGTADYTDLFKDMMHVQSFMDSDEIKWRQDFVIGGINIKCDINFAKLYDERGNYIGCYCTLLDRTDDLEKYRQERYKATHDSLTGIHNRDYFYEKALEMINENRDDPYYVICTDFKDFKLINDMFGYKKGNEILRSFAKNIKEGLPDGCLYARLVSDCFAILIPKRIYQEEKLIESIRETEALISVNDFTFHIHAGVYEVQPEDDDVSIMCDRANLAIRTIKNNYDKINAYYDEALMNKMINRKHMVNEFDNAIETGQFHMYLQPQVLTDGRVVGAEALVRWIHPEKGMISPGEFIPVFEDTGLIYRLDMCIWEQAAAKLKEWKEKGREDLHISVNISTKDFYYLDLYKIFTDLVNQYGIKPENLKLEITESSFMVDMDKQLRLITRLQKYGFHVEIDDFGSGYSSLNMLKNLKADVLKLDMGFLHEIEDRERTRAVLDMVVELAKRLQMTVISEGVEDKKQVDYLTEIGCDMFQGFYFAKPIPVRDFEKEYIQVKHDGNNGLTIS
ncbi:MAG: EAL domain-containing protein [Bacteroides sp.]|nr:EAL domain-containing protein [Bacteroides sp.]MCM1550133.1 EAL domain-containing protein [Clostridium sp.]